MSLTAKNMLALLAKQKTFQEDAVLRLVIGEKDKQYLSVDISELRLSDDGSIVFLIPKLPC